MSTPKHKLIAFAGPKGAGKSTAAGAFPDATRVSFASPIRQMLLALGVPEQNLIDPSLKEAPMREFGNRSARYLMQTLGKEWGRDLVSDNLWELVAVRFIKKALLVSDVVVDDCRFDNEADAIHALGGVVIEVMRDGCRPSQAHESERGLSPSKVDRAILNARDREFLYSYARDAVKEVLP